MIYIYYNSKTEKIEAYKDLENLLNSKRIAIKNKVLQYFKMLKREGKYKHVDFIIYKADVKHLIEN